MTSGRGVMAWALLVALSGCEPSNLYVAHDTVVGVNAQVSADRQQGRLVIGYDRDFVVLIPKSVDVPPDSDKPGDLGKQDEMSLLNCTELEVDGIFLTKYADSLASGDAAVEFAGKVDEATSFFDCHRRVKLKRDDQETGADGESDSSS